MNETDSIFALLRSALDGSTPDLPAMEAGQWWRLFRTMQQNHVAALTADAMARLDLPREVRVPWLAERDKAVRWHRYQIEVQQELVEVMARHGIETLVLKGTHTAQYWPHAELREFGDLDLYFYDRHAEADRVAREVLKADVSNDGHHHSKYNYRGVTVESHYDFVNIHYPPSNRRYEALLKELCPSATFEVLFLLRHMAGHFAAARITLRDLVDWALTCHAMNGKADWDLVAGKVQEFGMEPFVAAIGELCGQRLGLHDIPQMGDGVYNLYAVAHDVVYGTTEDHKADGFGRLGWKVRRWRALGWKRKMVYKENTAVLTLASIASHTGKPRSILHKM